MTLIVDITHWLDEHGDLPKHDLRLRRNALRIATFIEYGGSLARLEGRAPWCKRRPNRKPWLGLLWMVKRADDRIEAYCPTCRETEASSQAGRTRSGRTALWRPCT